MIPASFGSRCVLGARVPLGADGAEVRTVIGQKYKRTIADCKLTTRTNFVTGKYCFLHADFLNVSHRQNPAEDVCRFFLAFIENLRWLEGRVWTMNVENAQLAEFTHEPANNFPTHSLLVFRTIYSAEMVLPLLDRPSELKRVCFRLTMIEAVAGMAIAGHMPAIRATI